MDAADVEAWLALGSKQGTTTSNPAGMETVGKKVWIGLPCECFLIVHHNCHFFFFFPLLHGWFHQAVPHVPILVLLWHSKCHGPNGSAAWWQKGLGLLSLHLAFLQGLAPHPFSIPLVKFCHSFFQRISWHLFFQRFSLNLCSKVKAFFSKTPFSLD